MEITTRSILLFAMILLTVVSMWTTYESLKDSILPEPTIAIPITGNLVWECSIFALALSVAIGLMLYALKLAIIDEQKRLNIFGLAGMFVVAFISISFNMDVLYRTADRQFFVRYSNTHMRSAYETFLADAQKALTDRKNTIRRDVAKQQGELEAEIEGLRQAPAGYGQRAKQEDYNLTVLEKTSEIDLQSVEDALAAKEKADQLLLTSVPKTIEDVQTLQDNLRVAVKDVSALSGIPIPEPVELQTPLFAVFNRLFDLKTVGTKELFFVLIAIFLDLGDIIGYSMIPSHPKKRKRETVYLENIPPVRGPEFVAGPPALDVAQASAPLLDAPESAVPDGPPAPGSTLYREATPHRRIRFRHH